MLLVNWGRYFLMDRFRLNADTGFRDLPADGGTGLAMGLAVAALVACRIDTWVVRGGALSGLPPMV